MKKVNRLMKTFLSRIINLLRKMKIKNRLVLTVFLTTIVPILIIVAVIFTSATDLLMKTISNNSEQVMEIIVDDISEILEDYEAISNEILWSKGIIQQMVHIENLSSDEHMQFNNELDEILNNRITYMSDIADFTVLNEEQEIVFNKSFQFIPKQIKSEAIHKSLRNPNNVNWFQVSLSSGNYLTMVRPIKFQSNTYGYVYVAIKENVFKKVYQNFHTDSGGMAFIIDENDKVVSSNNESVLPIQSSLQKMDLKKRESIGVNSFKGLLDGKRIIINEEDIPGRGLKFIGIMPYSYFFQTFQSVFLQLMGIVLIIVLLFLLLSYVLYQSIMQPLRHIVARIDKLDENNLDNMLIEDGKDEITTISKSVNKMSKSLRTSLFNIQVKEREKHEMELKMLQAQINPHFLFNTLGSIRYLAMMNSAPVVASGIEALSSLLRNTILDKNEYVSVEEEIHNIENYVTIQKIRYGDGFTVKYQIDEGIKKEKILKFLLQPIVENAILHAFDERGVLNNLLIIGRKMENCIIFEICDNGIGIPSEKLENFQFNIEKFAGIGIKNVRDRILLHYPNEGAFSIHSIENKGTIVTIVYPIDGGS